MIGVGWWCYYTNPLLRFVNDRLGDAARLTLVDAGQGRGLFDDIVFTAGDLRDLLQRRARCRPVGADGASADFNFSFCEIVKQFIRRRRRVAIADYDHVASSMRRLYPVLPKLFASGR